MPSTHPPAAPAPAVAALILLAVSTLSAVAQPPLPPTTTYDTHANIDTESVIARRPPAPGGSAVRERPLIIRGLQAMMTGWHRVEALVSDRRIDRVEWQINGRRFSSNERLTADLYFGSTPQPRHLEALAYDREGVLRYTTAATVNAGGSAYLLDFVAPVGGRHSSGSTEIELCAYAPSDRPLDRVLIRSTVAGTELPLAVTAHSEGRGSCRQGTTYRAVLQLTAEPTVLTAELYARERGREYDPPQDRPRLERSIALNMRPAIAETVDVRLLEWPVRVFNKRQPVTGLSSDDFRLYEDRRECRIERILTPQQTPFRLALVFDWSGSTALDAGAEATAAGELLEHLFDPGEDSVMVAGIAHTPIRYLSWSSDEAPVRDALERIRSGYRLSGGTALYDTLVDVLYQFQSAADRGLPALVLITDGLDTASRDFSREQSLAYARESGVPIYPLAVRVRIDEQRTTASDLGFLEALAVESGGSLRTIELDGRPQRLRGEAASLRAQADSLRHQPGDLSSDPRFLEHLIREREARASKLEARAHQLDRRNQAPLEAVRTVFRGIERDLSSGYVLVARGQAERGDRWHPVEVELAASGRGGWQVHAPRGMHW